MSLLMLLQGFGSTGGGGSEVYPDEDDVRASEVYGPTGADYTGTLTLPAESQVLSGVQYGGDGTEFTGEIGVGGGSSSGFINLTAKVRYVKDSYIADLKVLAKQFAVNGGRYTKNNQSIGTTEEAIQLGEVGTLGYAIFINRDETNYLEIRSASGAGNDIIKLKAGELAMFRFGSDVTAPYAIANTSACVLEYLIIED